MDTEAEVTAWVQEGGNFVSPPVYEGIPLWHFRAEADGALILRGHCIPPSKLEPS